MTPDSLPTLQVLTALTSAVSLFVSWLSLTRTRSFAALQIEVQRYREELARRELAERDARDVAARRANVQLEGETVITNRGQSCRIVVKNVGPVSAFDVHVAIKMVGQGRHHHLGNDGYEVKLPIPVLASGDRQLLVASITMPTSTPFEAELSWRNADGSPGRRNQRLTLP